MILSVVASIIAAAVIAGVTWAVRNREWLRVLLPSGLAHPRQSVRVSIASIMRLRCEEGYVLFRTPLRPEAFAPPGGVVKYYPEALAGLDSMEFRSEVPRGAAPGRGERDLRGHVRIAVLPKFLRWYSTGVGRESHIDALRRELAEECQEIGIPRLASTMARLDFRYVRRVIERPSRATAEAPLQLRVIEVYEPLEVGGTALARLCDQLQAAARRDGEVVLASDAEIALGRCGTRVIAHTAGYLMSSKRLRPDLPPI